MAGDPNLLRILISTDNHLGVWEKDEIRRDDSFRAFEEVLQHAVQKQVDMVLLGGDLFHENKPSRSTLVRAIGLLSKYCLNDRPVRLRVLSDQRANFVSGLVNFENPNLNVGLPVFTIHGNHDDPAGQDSLSAVDILSQTGLVNYFGKHPLTGSHTRVTLSPVLLEKGATRLCLYGLGNIRDERLGRAFQTPGCVQWQRPAAEEGYPADGWINVFVLHQNRQAYAALAKALVKEEHIPPFVDLAVWGHEHECKPDPVPLRGEEGSRWVVQPGSTVATALSEGESRPKHCLLLEVRGDQFRVTKHRLASVRPFEFGNCCLRDAQPPLAPEDTEGVTAYIVNRVQEMIDAAAASQPHPPPLLGGLPGGAEDGAHPPDPPGPLLPLIRLRIDYTGFSTVNSQRLGQRFVGKVANPHDMLQWTKAAAKKVKGEPGAAAGGRGAAGAFGAEGGEDEGFLSPEALEQSRIEDLIRQHLGPNALEVLPDDELAQALHAFVEKDDKNALHACVEAAVQETCNAAVAGQLAPDTLGGGGGGAGGGAGGGSADGAEAAGGGGGGAGPVKAGGEEGVAGAVRAGAERRRQLRLQRQAEAGAAEGIDFGELGAAPVGGTGAYGGTGSAGGTAVYGAGADEDTLMTDAGGAAAPSQATTVTATGKGRGRGSRGGRQQSLADSLARGAGGRGGRGRGGPLDAFLAPAAPGGATPQATPAAPGRGGRAAAGRGRGRGRGAASPADSDDADMSDAGLEDSPDHALEDDLEDGDGAAGGSGGRKGTGQQAAAGGRRGAAAAAATPASAAKAGRGSRAAAAGSKRKSYRVESESDEEPSDEVEDSDEGLEDLEDEEDESPRPSRGRGRGKAAAGGRGRAKATPPKATPAGRGRGRGTAAAAAAAPGAARAGTGAADPITLSSDDDEPGPSLGPPAARAHAAAGAALARAGGAGSLLTASGTAGGTGGSTGATQGGGTGAPGGGGRKRPASFLTSSAAPTQGGRGGGGAGRGWGQAR